MRKTLLWKSAKPPLPGSPCHCRCYGVAVAMALLPTALLPTASLPPPLLRCRFRWRATPERREAIPTSSVSGVRLGRSPDSVSSVSGARLLKRPPVSSISGARLSKRLPASSVCGVRLSKRSPVSSVSGVRLSKRSPSFESASAFGNFWSGLAQRLGTLQRLEGHHWKRVTGLHERERRRDNRQKKALYMYMCTHTHIRTHTTHLCTRTHFSHATEPVV